MRVEKRVEASDEKAEWVGASAPTWTNPPCRAVASGPFCIFFSPQVALTRSARRSVGQDARVVGRYPTNAAAGRGFLAFEVRAPQKTTLLSQRLAVADSPDVQQVARHTMGRVSAVGWRWNPGRKGREQKKVARLCWQSGQKRLLENIILHPVHNSAAAAHAAISLALFDACVVLYRAGNRWPAGGLQDKDTAGTPTQPHHHPACLVNRPRNQPGDAYHDRLGVGEWGVVGELRGRGGQCLQV